MTKYIKYIKADPKETCNRHAPFLAARREFMKEHNRNPDRKCLHAKSKLQAASNVVQAQVKGTRYSGPEKHWVEIEAY